MHRTALRLSGFAVVLAVLFTGGWAVGEQVPTDDEPAPHQMDHTGQDADAGHGAGADTTGGEAP